MLEFRRVLFRSKENKSVEFIAQLMEKRKEKYEDAADVVIRTDGKTILQICEELDRKSVV